VYQGRHVVERAAGIHTIGIIMVVVVVVVVVVFIIVLIVVATIAITICGIICQVQVPAAHDCDGGVQRLPEGGGDAAQL
jgi:hypothetical protein